MHKLFQAIKSVISSHPGAVIALVLMLGLAMLLIIVMGVRYSRRNRRDYD